MENIQRKKKIANVPAKITVKLQLINYIPLINWADIPKTPSV